MRMAWVAAFVVTGCGDSKPQGPPPPMCDMESTATVCTQEAAAFVDCSSPTSGCFTFIKEKIFDHNCNLSECHSRNTAGNLVLSSDTVGSTVTKDEAYANLVGVTSTVNPLYTLVVPGKPEESYLLMLVMAVPPGNMVPPAPPPPENGYMPKDIASLFCCEKVDLFERWVRDGALNN